MTFNIIKIHKLEETLKSYLDAVLVRREILNIKDSIPYLDYDYDKIYKRNCENVIGYLTIPLGYVGPIKINNNIHHIPPILPCKYYIPIHILTQTYINL